MVELRHLLLQLHGKRKCKKGELRSLVGKLGFAARVIKPGRLFLRHLINLSTRVKEDFHYVTLNSEAKADIKWWYDALVDFNGISFILPAFTDSDTLRLHTDASGIGFGAVFGDKWFFHEWPESFSRVTIDINFRELFAIVVAFETWGHLFEKKQIKFYTDNENICNLWKSLAPKDLGLMRLLRHLYFRAFKNNCNVLLTHIPGKYNIQADLLSRLQVDKFKQISPAAEITPTPIPARVWSI